LMRSSELIITDSGGIQEEATAPPIRKPVLVIRLSTERPEAVEAGFARIIGTEKKEISAGIECALTENKELPATSPFGDGNSAERIVEIIKERVYSGQEM
jgi:UDP-N-acetylglucosamine 2-epimerase (non-hydrolysing)